MVSKTDDQERTDHWRRQLQDTRLSLEFAAQYCKEVQADYRAKTMPLSDGGFALERALRLEREAQLEYLRVLRICHDLAVYGKRPD